MQCQDYNGKLRSDPCTVNSALRTVRHASSADLQLLQKLVSLMPRMSAKHAVLTLFWHIQLRSINKLVLTSNLECSLQ